MDQYEFIRKASRLYGKGIRQIARETGHHRSTVRKALQGLSPEYRIKQPRQSPVMGPFMEIVDRWLTNDQQAPKKQRHSATRIYQRLVAEYQFEGSESTVRRYVRIRKAEMGFGKVEAMVPLCPDRPGEAEVDWGEAMVNLAGQQIKVQLFVMRSCTSGKVFVRAYHNQSQEMFFDGHIHAFAYFGGVFPFLVYDNLKAAVARVLRGRQREEQRQFQTFRAHYTFESRFCNVARGNEKGGVEGGVKYVRQNLLVPIPEVADLEELNQQLQQGCEQLSERILGGREERKAVEAHFQAEKPRLLALPEHPFSNEKVLRGKVTKYQTVRVNRVRYSVPTRYVNFLVTVRLGCERVTIEWGGKEIACHKRCFTRDQWVLDPLHYLGLIKRKIGSFEHARPIKEWQKSWPASHETLRRQMIKRKGDIDGDRAFVEVLMLYQHHEQKAVEDVIAFAASKQITDLVEMRRKLHEQIEAEESAAKPVASHRLPPSCRQLHEPPDMSKYDLLVGSAR